jgi:hypothetical protein
MAITIKKTGEIAGKRVVMMVVGTPGIGKTSLIRSLPAPESETLMISLEGGTACLDDTNFDVVEIDMRNPVVEMEEMYELLTTDDLKRTKELNPNWSHNVVYKKRYKYVFIDSLTEMGQGVISFLKKDPHYGQAKNTLQLYGKYAEIMTVIIKGFRDMTDYSVIFTCLDAIDKDGLEKIESVNIPGSSIKNGIRAWFDIVLSYKTYKDEEGNIIRKLISDVAESPIAKDRTGKLDSFEDADLGVIINKITGK